MVWVFEPRGEIVGVALGKAARVAVRVVITFLIEHPWGARGIDGIFRKIGKVGTQFVLESHPRVVAAVEVSLAVPAARRRRVVAVVLIVEFQRVSDLA